MQLLLRLSYAILSSSAFKVRCYFHLVNGPETILDDIGIEVSDFETAKAEARRALAELRQEAEGASGSWDGWRFDIVCPAGNLLYSFSLNKTLH